MTARTAPQPDWMARLGPARPLHFASADAALDLPAHVRAGSGLRRWQGHLVVLQDDVHALALVEEASGRVSPLLLPTDASGLRQFSEQRGNKGGKMDLEACVVLGDGRLLALGSGSTAARERLVVVDKDRSVRIVDGAALYAQLRSRRDFAGSELNIEGAVVDATRLRLFQRGNGAVVDGQAAAHAIGDLDMAALLHWLDDGGPTPQLIAVRSVDLGHIGGVPLGFTDATLLPDGTIVFLAGAEDSPDTYRDGKVLGTRVGLLDGERLVLAEIRDAGGLATGLKLEGVEFVGYTDAGGIALLVVADMDDPDTAAVMATLTWGPP